MAKANVITLASLLSSNQADTGHLGRFYDEAVRSLANSSGHLTQLGLVAATTGTATYTAPTDAVNILTVFYNTRELYEDTQQGLMSALGPDWRTRTGQPITYTRADDTDRTVHLCPVPTTTGESYIPLSTLFGTSYPADNVIMGYTEYRADVPIYLELYLALAILAREFMRDSPHQDATYASACSALATLTLGIVS